mgnify:CR=1 FL=1
MERTYIIPLRKAAMKAPNYKRTPRAVKEIRLFLQKHMKSDDVRLGRQLNVFMWKRGSKNPPHKVEVSAEVMEDDGKKYVYAELVGVTKEALKPVVVAKKEGIAGKLEDLVGTKKDSPKKSEEKEKKEILTKETVEKNVSPALDEKKTPKKKEILEREREEKIVTRDMKQERKKKE